jgi:LysR family cyn operon transcriptional activator
MNHTHGAWIAVELRHLRYFVSVAEATSVSKAAVRIHISQPALSRQIHELQQELGVRLFDRVGRGIRLTAEGDELLASARDVLARVEALGARARALGDGTTGVLRVGATPQTLRNILPGFLTRYRKSRPGIEIQLVEDGGARLLSLVEQGTLHLAMSGVLTGTRLEQRLLFPIRVLAVTSLSPRWRKRTTIEARELAGEPLLLLRQDFGTRQLFDAACRIAHIQRRIVLEGGEPSSLVALAEQGHGVAVVPSTVRFTSKNIRILPILQDGKSLGTWGSVIWDARRVLPVYATSFIEELTDYARRVFPGKQFERIAPPVAMPPVEPVARV